MRVKKNAFGYVSLLCGTLFMSVCLYTLFVSFYKDLNFEALSNIKCLDYLIPGFFVLLVIGLFAGYRLLRKNIFSKVDYPKNYTKLSRFCCVFSAVAILSAAFLVHKNVLDTTLLLSKATNSGYTTLTDYFYKEDVSFYNAFQFLYTGFISILFRFYGIAIEVPVITNLILFLISGVFIFVIIYKVLGITPAIAGSFAFFLSKNFEEFCFDFYGKNLWIFVSSFFVFIGVLIFEKIFYRNKVAFNFCFFALLAITSLCKHFLIRGYVFSTENIVFSFDIVNSGNQIFDIVVVILCLFGFIYYLFDDKDNISLVFIIFLISYFAINFSVGDILTELFVYIVIASLAGLGVNGLIVNGPYIYKHVEPVTDDSEAPVKEKNKKIFNIFNRFKTDESDSDDDDDLLEESLEDAEKAENIDLNDKNSFKKVPAYFDSPIPLPKKHIRKAIEFDFEPKKEDMHFDYDVPVSEDYDVK